MINYCVDYKGVLHIYKDNYILFEISECENMSEEELKTLVNNVVEEWYYELC